jgi:PadR family transcriptional regulator PadR
MVLKTLHSMGPLHGFGIARRIEQLSEDVLQLNEVREIRADGK